MIRTNKVYVIAEAGVNHNGDLSIALKLIDAAKEVGADCVKFQTFKAEQIVTKTSPKAAYQLEVTNKMENQYEMLKKLELDFDAYHVIIKKCNEIGIDFLSTPYNKEDVDFLLKLGVEGFKIASGQLTELPFLRYCASKGKRMIISTGMSSMSDVFNGVETIRNSGNNDIVALQCTTNYPSMIEDANLLAMISIRDACKVEIGYSDHVPNNYACFAAVALGAKIIEKHFTIDKQMEGPDHSSSLNETEFKELVVGIRNVEKSLGTGLKTPTSTEMKNIFGMKRSLVVLKDVAPGDVITEDIIGFKRPSNGLSVNYLEKIIGKTFSKTMIKDEALQYNSIEW